MNADVSDLGKSQMTINTDSGSFVLSGRCARDGRRRYRSDGVVTGSWNRQGVQHYYSRLRRDSHDGRQGACWRLEAGGLLGALSASL